MARTAGARANQPARGSTGDSPSAPAIEPRGFPGGPGPGGFGRRGGPRFPTEYAPIMAADHQVGVVAVPSNPPPVSVALRELGPTLTWLALGLLVLGATLTALFVFRPVHKRIRSLEHAARALGEGRTDVRATDSGGDEVSSLARTFNRMAEDLESRATALAASDRARRQLLADVSHELMTPLSAIRGYVETLGMADVPLDQRHPHALSRYRRTGNAQARSDHWRPARSCASRRGRRSTEIGTGGGRRSLQADRRSPRAVAARSKYLVADRCRARHAARSRRRGTPRTGAAESRRQCDPPHAGGRNRPAQRVLQPRTACTSPFRDTGPGIPEEHLPRVFDRFYKVDASRAGTAVPSGSGLGLSIVRAIIERHGGTVTAANAPDGGAMFELQLPAACRTA